MNENIDDYGLVSFLIEKEQIENFDFSQILPALDKAKEEPNKYFNKITFMVGGYDEDKRELCEIPEVRRYIKFLDKSFPYYFFFINKDLPLQHSPILIFLYCTLEYDLVEDKGTHKTLFISPERIWRFIEQHLPYFNEMMDSAGFSAEKQEIVFDELMNFLKSLFNGD